MVQGECVIDYIILVHFEEVVHRASHVVVPAVDDNGGLGQTSRARGINVEDGLCKQRERIVTKSWWVVTGEEFELKPPVNLVIWS